MTFGGVAIGEIGYASVLPPGPTVLYVAGDEGVGIWDGAAWTLGVVTPFGAVSVESVACQLTDPTIVYALNGNGTAIAKSIDSGVTWSALTIPVDASGYAQTLAVDASGRVYIATSAAANKQIQRSSDGGSTWSVFAPFTPSGSGGRNVDFTPSGRVWSGNGNAATQLVQRFDSNGTNRLSGIWPDGDFGHGCKMRVAFGSESRCWYVSEDGVSPQFLRFDGTVATDMTAGIPWADMWDVLDLGGNVLISAFKDTPNGQLYRSTDDGISWTNTTAMDAAHKPFGRWPHFAVDPSDATRLYYISQTQLYVSTDSGQTWSAAAGSIPVTQCAALAVAG